MNVRRIVFAGILIVVASAVTFGWYRYVAHPAPVVCSYSNRPLHRESLRLCGDCRQEDAGLLRAVRNLRGQPGTQDASPDYGA